MDRLIVSLGIPDFSAQERNSTKSCPQGVLQAHWKTPDFGILPLAPKPVFVQNGHLTTYSQLSEGENAKYLQQQLSTSV